MLGMFTLKNTSAAQKWKGNNMVSGWILPNANRGIQELESFRASEAKHLHVRQKSHLKSRARIKSWELPRATGLYKPRYMRGWKNQTQSHGQNPIPEKRLDVQYYTRRQRSGLRVPETRWK